MYKDKITSIIRAFHKLTTKQIKASYERHESHNTIQYVTYSHTWWYGMANSIKHA